MAIHAVRPLLPTCLVARGEERRADAAALVHACGDRLEVVGVDTGTIPAQVVEL